MRLYLELGARCAPSDDKALPVEPPRSAFLAEVLPPRWRNESVSELAPKVTVRLQSHVSRFAYGIHPVHTTQRSSTRNMCYFRPLGAFHGLGSGHGPSAHRDFDLFCCTNDGTVAT